MEREKELSTFEKSLFLDGVDAEFVIFPRLPLIIQIFVSELSFIDPKALQQRALGCQVHLLL